MKKSKSTEQIDGLSWGRYDKVYKVIAICAAISPISLILLSGAFPMTTGVTNQELALVAELQDRVSLLEKEVEEAKKAACTSAPPASGAEEVEALRRQMDEAVGSHNKEKLQLSQSLAKCRANESALALGGSDEAMRKAVEAAKSIVSQCGSVSTASLSGSRLYACNATEEDLRKYMNYTPGAQCPDDWFFIQELIFLKNCFCLPTRQCFTITPINYQEPTVPFPQSLFDQSVLQNSHVRWTQASRASYEEINSRTWGDCVKCFNLSVEEQRWNDHRFQEAENNIDFVMGLKPKGAIKIGLDAGGGTGTFAAKMAQRGVTMVTTAMNTETEGPAGGLPYMETIAQRGLVPLHVPHKVRQPFFDGTLDIIHSSYTVKFFTIPEFELLLYEWDRILRPGGIIYLEYFFARKERMPFYLSILEGMGYNKLNWKLGAKKDRPDRADKDMLLTAVLEKPITRNVLPTSQS